MVLSRRFREGRERCDLGFGIEACTRCWLPFSKFKRQGTYVALVVPAVFLFGEDALQSFAV